jgi:hypothetical protein
MTKRFDKQYSSWTMADDERFNIENVASRGNSVEELMENAEISICDWNGNEAREGWTSGDLASRDFQELEETFRDWLAGDGAMSYTKGPWTYHTSGHLRQLDPLGFNQIPRTEADRQLIAAAPSLFEAIEIAVRRLEAIRARLNDGESPNLDIALSDIEFDLEQVIKQAKGKT